MLTSQISHLSPAHPLTSLYSRMRSPTINEIITKDYRAALTLDAYGIDFCYSGKKTLEEVSLEQHLDKHILEEAVANLNALPPHWDYVAWDTKFLVDFIIHTHHNYYRETLPKLLLLADIVIARDGPNHPEMHPIIALMINLDQRIKGHLISEEYALFPYLLEMELARSNKQRFLASENGRLEKPIHIMMKDHYQTAEVLKEIRELSQYFQQPPGTCRECALWYQLQKEFDADMRLHIHLENNILFPRVLAQESELIGRMGWSTGIK